jgi:tripartite-type tricarboxylate transporter receptor subunit TctC
MRMSAVTRLLTPAFLAALCALASTTRASAADYPTRPVSIITSGSAGSGPDVIARLFADRFAQTWGQQGIVLNRPGAAGILAAQSAATAPADGYTLYIGFSSTFLVLPETQQKLAVDLKRDIVPIGLLGEQPMVIAVTRALGINSLAELLARARQRPGEVLYGAPRSTMPHLVGVLLSGRAGVEFGFIPSTVPRAVQDVMGGSIHVTMESAGALAGAIQSGLVKPLAVTASSRLPNFPEIPTVTEAVPSLGIFEARGWVGLFAPAATPEAIVQKVNADLRAILADPEFVLKLAALGAYPRPMSPAETAEFVRREQDLWRPIVRQLDLTSN